MAESTPDGWESSSLFPTVLIRHQCPFKGEKVGFGEGEMGGR